LFFSFLWFSPFPVFCIIQYKLLIHRHELLRFLKSWNRVEKQFSLRGSAIKTRIMYTFYCLHVITTMIVTFCWSYSIQTEAYLLPSIQILRETLGPLFLSLITSFVYYFYILIHNSGILIPSLFYCHAGCAIESLEQELLRCYSSPRSIPQNNFIIDSATLTSVVSNPETNVVRSIGYIWEQYEVIFDLVNEANQLFGAMIVISDCTLFMYVCLMVYGIFIFAYINLFLSGILIAISFTYILQIVFSNRLMCHLYLSSNRLESSVSRLLSKKWKVIMENNRNQLDSFHSRLGRHDMVANPLNLYVVTPNNLLSMFAVGVSYIIIFLQSAH